MRIRSAERDELESIFQMMSGPFGFDMPEGEELEKWLGRADRQFEPERARLADDDGKLVGTLLTFSLDVSVPGSTLPMAGTTGVTVRTSHRRRGVLRRMMRAHLEDAAEREEPAAALWASDSAIYGRFGYGMAAYDIEVEIDREHTDFHRLAPEPAPVTEVDRDDVDAPARSVYDAMIGSVPGALVRNDDWWSDRTLGDRPNQRDGAGKARYVLAWDGDTPVGWAKFRLKDGKWSTGHADQEVVVVALHATTPAGWAGVWSHVLSHDFAAKITAHHRPLDDPVESLLAGMRRVRRRIGDGLWIRPIDTAALLTGRSYLGNGSVSIEVIDGEGFAGGRFTVDVEDGRATVRPADRAEVTMDVEDLGAISLGGRSVSGLRAAGRVDADPEAARALDRLVGWDRAPWCPEVF